MSQTTNGFQSVNKQFSLLPPPKPLTSASTQSKTDLSKSLKLLIGRVSFIRKFKDENPSDLRIYETYGKILKINKDSKLTLFIRDLYGGPVIQFETYETNILNQELEIHDLVKIVGDLIFGANLRIFKISKITDYPTKFELERVENKMLGS